MSRFIFKSATIMGLSTFISRILGFIRDMVIANFIGAGNQADAFFVAFRIPNLLRRLFGEGSLTVAFIPVFTKYKIEKGKDEADIIASISFTLLIIILLIITSAGVIFSAIYMLNNNSFIYNIKEVVELREFIYYGFVVFTSLGFGDIVPASDLAKSATTLWAILGQLYTSFVIAIIVGKYLSKKNN